MAEAVPNNTTTLEINTNDGVVNMNNQILFTVAAPMSLHQRHILYDARRVPLYTLYKKKFSMHDRWKVYNGESTNSPDFSFSVMRKSMIQWGIVELKVFLANNRDEKVCDYVIYAGFLRRSCTIVSVHSSTVVAKV